MLDGGDGELLPAYPEEEYQKLVARMMKARNFLPLTRKPAGLSPQARFGLNLRIENDPRIMTWVLDGDEKKGYLLYADLNGNGDLSDEAPLRFEQKDGKYFYLFRGTGRDAKTEETYPIAAKLIVTQATPQENRNPDFACGVTARRSAGACSGLATGRWLSASSVRVETTISRSSI